MLALGGLLRFSFSPHFVNIFFHISFFVIKLSLIFGGCSALLLSAQAFSSSIILENSGNSSCFGSRLSSRASFLCIPRRLVSFRASLMPSSSVIATMELVHLVLFSSVGDLILFLNFFSSSFLSALCRLSSACSIFLRTLSCSLLNLSTWADLL